MNEYPKEIQDTRRKLIKTSLAGQKNRPAGIKFYKSQDSLIKKADENNAIKQAT